MGRELPAGTRQAAPPLVGACHCMLRHVTFGPARCSGRESAAGPMSTGQAFGGRGTDSASCSCNFAPEAKSQSATRSEPQTASKKPFGDTAQL
mmetsp:Transcript_74262/g.205741  ORF Transcript_74262/g.205741 Transcript_74262/m.205741 type:complete len:93 (+) Transcript_74262:57-335(+)